MSPRASLDMELEAESFENVEGRLGGVVTTAIWPRRRIVSTGNRTASSSTCDPNVAIEYILGVSTGSMPNRERRKSGVEAEISVERVEWRSVTGAIENGRTQD